MDHLRTQVYKIEDFKPQGQDSKFVIEGTLGRGGMGTIYDAFDRNIRRKVAIKSINEEAAQNSVSRKYFVKERPAQPKLGNLTTLYIRDRRKKAILVNLVVQMDTRPYYKYFCHPSH